MDRSVLMWDTLARIYRHPQTKLDPLGVTWRVVRWQLRKRLGKKPLEFNYINNTSFIVRRGWPVSSACWYFGLHEFESMAFLVHLLREDDLVVDAGAHIGSYSIALASTGAYVLAVEPDRAAREYLIEHRTINGLEQRIEVIPKALGTRKEKVRMSDVADQQAHVRRAAPQGHTVEMTTLDNIVNDRKVTAMKIDVEGFEMETLQGAHDVLSDCMAVCIETMGLGARYGASDEMVMNVLRNAGFFPIDYDPEERTITRSERKKVMRLFIRDIKWTRERVETSQPIAIFGQSI